MRYLVIANQKGGVGKTTTALNVGAGLARSGKRVLLIDIDPQANLTTGLLGTVEPELTVYDLLVEEAEPAAVIIPAPSAGVDVIPSSIDLAGAEVELVSTIGGQTVLRTKLSAASLDYDFVIIDPPPSLGLLTINALAASREVIIPVSASFFGLKGIVRLEKTIESVRARLDTPQLHIAGVLATMTDNTRVSSDVEEAIRQRFGGLAFTTTIPRNVRVEEAHSLAVPVLEHAPESKGAQADQDLVKEIIDRG
jgi:chromosome partitioning protein